MRRGPHILFFFYTAHPAVEQSRSIFLRKHLNFFSPREKIHRYIYLPRDTNTCPESESSARRFPQPARTFTTFTSQKDVKFTYEKEMRRTFPFIFKEKLRLEDLFRPTYANLPTVYSRFPYKTRGICFIFDRETRDIQISDRRYFVTNHYC